MFKNYFKTAWRNLLKNKVYSFINVVGLSTGMAVALLIGLWIWDEVSYNKSFSNYDHIAAVMQHNTHDGNIVSYDELPQPLARVLREKYGDDLKGVALISDVYPHIL